MSPNPEAVSREAWESAPQSWQGVAVELVWKLAGQFRYAFENGRLESAAGHVAQLREYVEFVDAEFQRSLRCAPWARQQRLCARAGCENDISHRRADARFCTDACKQAAWRERRSIVFAARMVETDAFSRGRCPTCGRGPGSFGTAGECWECFQKAA